VRTIGGTSGHLHSHVDGVPIFRSGEEVYLFLWERPGEPYRVLGWAQGTFRIARNADTGTNPSPKTQLFYLCSIHAREPSGMRHPQTARRNFSVEAAQGIGTRELRRHMREKFCESPRQLRLFTGRAS